MGWWFFKKKKVGLALGGGVALGIAHIGVLKVLDALKIPIDYVTGTSSGSLVGAAYASGMAVSLIEQIATRIHWHDLFRISFFQPGIISEKVIEDLVIKYIGEKNFSDLKIPFATVATDVHDGQPVLIGEGPVARAVAASSAFPGIFSPTEIRGRFLIDGGIAANVPVDAARRLGAEFVIACDVIPGKLSRNLPRDPFQVFGCSLDLIFKRLSSEEARRADILIELELEEDLWYLDLHKAKRLIAAGEVAAHRSINKIKKALGIRSGS
jgi:NTE family protein